MAYLCVQTTVRHAAGQRHPKAVGTWGEVETCWHTGACVLPDWHQQGQFLVGQITFAVLKTHEPSLDQHPPPKDHPEPSEPSA